MNSEQISWCKVQLQREINKLKYYNQNLFTNENIKEQLEFNIKFWENEIDKLKTKQDD